MNRVFVVAWQYHTGAGFDWYRTEEAASGAFTEEQINVQQFANENWTAYFFPFDTPFSSTRAITHAIDGQFDSLCSQATIYSGPGFNAINEGRA